MLFEEMSAEIFSFGKTRINKKIRIESVSKASWGPAYPFPKGGSLPPPSEFKKVL